MDDSRVRDAASLLAAFFDADTLRRGGRFASFAANWSYIVGERLAAHSRVADVDKGVLIVEADHPGWIQLLQLRQAEILESVARRFPELGLRSIVFRLSRGAEAGAKDPAGGESPHIGPFGPGGRPADEGVGPAPAGPGKPPGGTGGGGVPAEADLASIADPGLRALLAGLKHVVDGEKD